MELIEALERMLVRGDPHVPMYFEATDQERVLLEKLGALIREREAFSQEKDVYRKSLESAVNRYQETLRNLSAFKRLSELTSDGKDIDTLCNKVLYILATELAIENCSIYFPDASGEYLVFKAGLSRERVREKQKELENDRFPVGEGAAGIAAASRQVVLVEDVSVDKAFKDRPTHVKIGSLLSLPLVSCGSLIGVINLSHPRKYYFNESHRNIYGMFAAAFAEILSYAKIDEELQRFNVELERRVEERTREVESYQKSIEGILLKSRDMMIVTDSRGKIKLVNPSALKLGYKKEELEGKSLETVIHPGQGDLLAALLTADGVEDFETEFIDKAGRERKILINTILLEEGHEGAYLVTARDVTEKRMFHEKLMRAERLAYIGELASGVAHEINNKLVPVLGYAELLMDDRKEEKEVRMLQRIKESAIGAKNVIQSLLKFSRQEKLEKRLSDINELLSDTVEMYRLRLKNTKIEIVTNLSPDLPRTVLDRQQMQQVAVNLINNAVHSMKNTGGKLEVSTSMSEKSGIEIRIADTGPGIPEDIAERIFDPFFTTKDVGEGTGLGLSICYGIICEHGGEINFSSRPGGTVFTVRIPVNERTGEDAPAAGKRPLSLTRSGDSSGRSILAIDDDKDQLDLLEEVLGGKYEVVTAKTGLEALQNLKNTDFDLVLTDVRMPGLNGIAVLGWIKKHKAALKDKVIFITGDTCEPSLHKFIEENGVPALAKPYNIGDLLETVEEVLSGPREGATAVFF